ncbi:thermonuclease family protein, partial [bacterium]|nr:thermonuclease family protein [bacterium]
VKPISEKIEEAINFIQQMTKGQKVFLKFDKQKHDADNTLLAYLYLKNKTFINMHLIKNQLAEVDTLRAYRAKDRMLSCYHANGLDRDHL